MKSLFAKHCLRQCLIFLGFFVLLLLIMLGFGAMQNAIFMGFIIGLIFGSLFLLIPALFYLVTAIRSVNRSNKCQKQTCKINNWNSWARMFGRVSVILNNKEYSTPAFFTCGEARSLVGKDISFCLLDETLFIFEILEPSI